MSCSLFRDAYKNITYDGKSMLHWCEREVGWATDWLLKTYVPGNGTQVGKWGANDKFVAMVRIRALEFASCLDMSHCKA